MSAENDQQKVPIRGRLVQGIPGGGSGPAKKLSLRILALNTNQPYLHLLGGLPHRFVVVDSGLRSGDCRWNRRLRPLPPGWRTASLAEAASGLAEGPCDVALVHSISDLLLLKDVCRRRILVIHDTLGACVRRQARPIQAGEFSWLACRYLEDVPAEVVFVSELKAQSWPEVSGRVITHGLPLAKYGGYTGEHPAVLHLVDPAERGDGPLRWPLLREALYGIPVSRLVWNNGPAAATGDVDWRQLKSAYRRHRCLLVANHPALSDGYDLTTLEAMATGMPVVTTPHHTSPIQHEWNGLIGQSSRELRAHVTRLLHDPELARRLGRRARQTVREQFAGDLFLADWDRLLQEVAAADRPDRRPSLRLIQGGRTVATAGLRSPRGG